MKMFAAVYGDEAQIRRILESAEAGVLYYADLLNDGEMQQAAMAELYGRTAGIAVHRGLIGDPKPLTREQPEKF